MTVALHGHGNLFFTVLSLPLCLHLLSLSLRVILHLCVTTPRAVYTRAKNRAVCRRAFPTKAAVVSEAAAATTPLVHLLAPSFFIYTYVYSGWCISSLLPFLFILSPISVCVRAHAAARVYILLSPSRAMRPECIMCVSADRLKLLYINRSFGEREARSESVAYARRGGTREKRVCIHTQLARGRRVARVAGRSASFLCDRACGGDIPYDVIRDSRR